VVRISDLGFWISGFEEEANTVWTPKRIVLLALGFALLLASYLAYSSYLGGIDGLAPLPEALLPPDGPGPDLGGRKRTTIVDERLAQAFGVGCDELNWHLRTDVPSKGMVLAAESFKIENDGWNMVLEPFSVALFSKKTPPGQYPEINTMRCAVAYLTFDRPVNNPGDIGKCKITGAELRGKKELNTNGQDGGPRRVGKGITITNNRHKPNRSDEISVWINEGPVFYEERHHTPGANDRKPDIWTKDVVHLKDFQSKPLPTTIDGEGMDVYLTVSNPTPGPGHGQETTPQRGETTRERAEITHHRDETTPQPGAHKPPRGEMVSGVERIVLHAGVEMHLFSDGNSSFLANGDDKGAGKAKGNAAKPAPTEPTRKTEVIVTTDGPFSYDLEKDVAHFNIPDAPQQPAPRGVHVDRINEPGMHDQLNCDQLVLTFQRKKAADGQPGDGKEPQLEIDTAHATGSNVILTSDAQVLDVQEANDLFYEARTHTTTIKGEHDIHVFKEGNRLEARQLQIMQQEGAQEMTALGPGFIEMRDKQTKKITGTARWKDTLTSKKEGLLDLLTLTNEAMFVDEEQGQELHADTLRLWLEPAAQAIAATQARPAVGARSGDRAPALDPAPSTNTQPLAGEGGRRPHHLKGDGHVGAKSRDLIVHDTDQLAIWFRDAPPRTQLPDKLPPARGGQPAGKSAAGAGARSGDRALAPGRAPAPDRARVPATAGPVAAKPMASAGVKAAPGATAAKPGTQPPGGDKVATEKPPRPMDVSAHLIEAYVLRLDNNKNELDRLWTEGRVRVRQEPEKPDDKGLNIKGDTLEVTRQSDGNLLVVTGKDVAELQMDKMLILGPVINIDQERNEAWVNGSGAMRMESATTLQGGRLERTVPMTIYWYDRMLFTGQHAEFYGSIQAEQDNGRLTCQALQVDLDRAVSLREGNKDGQNAKVDRLVCDKSVRVEDSEWENGRRVKYQRIESPTLVVDNADSTAVAGGPGIVRILQPGNADAPPAVGPTSRAGAQPGPARLAGPTGGRGGRPAPEKAKAPEQEQLNLTRVKYRGRMWANNKNHTAVFSDDVEVIHLPADNPNLEPDLDELAKDALYLRCSLLKVRSRPENGKSNQELEAHDHVVARSQEFEAHSDKLTYDEAKDQIVLEGGEGGKATMYRFIGPQGVPPQKSTGRKITYWRKTGELKVDDAGSISGSQAP
jgi:hypothetical protein